MLSEYTVHLRVLPSQIQDLAEQVPISLEESYKFCMDVFKTNAKSFHFASRYLDEEQRRSFAALYGFCRMADDFADELNLTREERDRELDILADIANHLSEGKTYNHPLFRAFGDTMQKYKIPVKYLHELIAGVRMDLIITDVKTVAELDKYCYHVASTVGLMMCHIWGATDSWTLDRAADLGLALQLTNILRDIDEDYKNGRIYIPCETRDAFRVSDEDFKHQRVTPNFRMMLQHEIARARSIYARAEVGIQNLPPGGAFTVKVASRVYGGIMDQIEKMDYQVFAKRAVVPKWKKLVIAMRCRREYKRELKAYNQMAGLTS